MARPESKMKMGYLPIEPHHYAAILSLVAPAGPDSGHKLLDPFAGEGAFLEAASQAWHMTPYANELDAERADHCRARFGPTQAVRCDVERLSASTGAFSAAWLNPPYDYDRAAKNSKRVEFAYLRHSWKWLCEGGIGLWCVYQQHLTEEAAAFFAKNSRRVDVWGLPGLHQGEYSQIVVVAVKTAFQEQPGPLYEHLLAARTAPQPLTIQTEPVYTLPKLPTVKHFVFAPDLIDEEQGLRLVSEQGAWQTAGFQALLSVPPPPVDIVPPVVPRPGHTALVLAAGIADGAVIPHETYGQVALRGTTIPVEQVARVEIEETPHDPDHPLTKTTMRLKPTTTLTLLAQDGTVVEMDGDEALLEFIRTHRQPLTTYLNTRFRPLYEFDLNGLGGMLGRLRLNGKYPLYLAQQHVIAALTKAFEARDKLLLIGAMGVGKTAIASAVTLSIATGAVKALRGQMKDQQVTLIVAPPHLIEKWKRELLSLSPQAYIAQLDRHEDVKAFMAKAAQIGGIAPKIGLIKRDMTKLGGARAPSVVWRTVGQARWRHDHPTPNGFQAHERIVKERIPLCPVCHAPVIQRIKDTAHPATDEWLRKGQRRCETCDSPLWQVARERGAQAKDGAPPPRNPRVRLDEYIKRHYADRVFLLIWDEAHEAANGDRGNGEAFGRLAGVAKKVLAMTGTPFNGRSSSLFNLEFHLNPRIRQAYPWGGAVRLSPKIRGGKGMPRTIGGGAERGHAESRWVADMGVLEQIIEERPTYNSESGVYTGTATYARPYEEAPGISPRLVAELLDHALFFSLGDLGYALPPFEEIAVPVEPDHDTGAIYQATRDVLKDYLIKRRWEGDSSFRGGYLQWSMSWLNTPHLPYPIIHNCKDRLTGRVRSHTVKSLNSAGTERVYAKEQALIDLVTAELAANRPCVIYVRQTDKRDLQPRLADLLTRHVPGVKPFILRDSISAERRERVINTQVEAGMNVMISNPELVKTGIDLLFAPTLVFYEPTFNLSTMMQAAARSYRMNQKRDCRVVYLFYTGSMEHHAIQLMSRKQRAAKMVNGEIGLSGLDALTSGESGLEEALLRMLGREEALINPADLFKREALNPLDMADADFWQAAVAPKNEPEVIVSRPVMLSVSKSEAPRSDPLLSVAAELGATVTPMTVAAFHAGDDPHALSVRLAACLNAAHMIPERQTRLEPRLLTALSEGTPTGDTTPDALTRWITKLLRVEKAVAPEQLPDLVTALIALTVKTSVTPVVTRPAVPVLLPKAAASTKGPSKPQRKPDLMAVPDERPIAPVAVKSPASRPQRSVAPSRQQLLFDLPHVHA